jgi:hypothetical protein
MRKNLGFMPLKVKPDSLERSCQEADERNPEHE